MKYRVETREDDKGRLDILKLLKDTRPFVTMNFEYSPDGGLGAVDFVGSRRNMPSIQEILAIVNSKFIDRISEVVKLTEILPLTVDVIVRPTAGTGKIIFIDDFEATLLKWICGGGTGAIDATYAFNGEASLKLTVGGGFDYVTAIKRFPMRPSLKFGLEGLWSVDDWTTITSFEVCINMYDTKNIHQCGAKYLVSDKHWYYVDETQTWQKIVESKQTQHYEEKLNESGAWHYLKLIGDFRQSKNVSLAVNSQLFDLSEFSTYKLASAQEMQAWVTLRLDKVAATTPTAWFDDVIVTEE